MTTKDSYTISKLSCWPDDYKIAIGNLVIAHSQLEYVLELLYKDLTKKKLSKQTISEADKQIRSIENIINLLKALDTSSEQTEIIKELNKINNNKKIRHVIIHGLHLVKNNNYIIKHIYNGNCSTYDITINKITEAANAIHAIAININKSRHTLFEHKSFTQKETSSVASCDANMSTLLPLGEGV